MIIGSLGFSFLALFSLSLHAQSVRRVNVGVLVYFTEREARLTERLLINQLRATPGHPATSYHVTVLYTPFDVDATAAAVRRLQALQPHIVLVSSPILVEFVLSGIAAVPVVSAGEAFIENLPYVQTVARPGGRVTGFFRQVNQLSKRVEMLKNACPNVQRVGFVTNSDRASDSDFLEFLDRESRLLRKGGIAVTPLYLSIHHLSSLPALIRRHHLDALDIQYSVQIRDHFAELKAIVEPLGIPHVYNRAQAVEDGGAFAAQPASFDFVKTGAEYIVRIANGEKVGDIPIQISRAYDIVINTERIQEFKGCDARRIARIATRFYPQ